MHLSSTYVQWIPEQIKIFHDVFIVKTVHFGMKLYNDQINAQVFNLFVYLFLPYMFRAFF
jgi:hypothetical protein